MKKNCLITLSLPLVLLLSTMCRADLMVDISGVAGTGTTNWVFSGTEVAGADEDFDSGFLSDFGSVWVNQGDFLNSGWTNTNIVPPLGVTITTSFGTRNVDLLYLAEQGDGPDGADPGADDFGVGVDGTNLQFVSGETISWTGSFVLNEDLENMKIGTYSYNYFANIFDTLDLTVTISASGVPEPTSMTLLGFCGLAISLRRRKRPVKMTEKQMIPCGAEKQRIMSEVQGQTSTIPAA